MTVYSKFTQIEAIVLDIDGVLTDNQILVTDHGEFLRTFNVRDGYAIKRAVAQGFRVAAISGGRSVGVRKRLEVLGVEEIHLGVEQKLPVLQRLTQIWNIPASKFAYMGDDIPDVPPLLYCGLACCPSDAVQEVLDTAAFISPYPGGRGCVRDLIEKILRAQTKW